MLPKRSQIKSQYRAPLSESPMEEELYYQLVRLGLRYARQHPVGPFFVDIAHAGAKIAIEYDGQEYHVGRESKDAARDEYFKDAGWMVFRVNRNHDLADAANHIHWWVVNRSPRDQLRYASEDRGKGFVKIVP